MSAWDPDQYHRFRNERSQPFFDLLDLCSPIPGGRAIDLGCGTGELTRVLHERVQARATIGLDNSETMLARAAEHAGGGLTFKYGTILRFAPSSPFELVFSNAALQWAPDHPKLFERLAAGLAADGQLAVQVPANDDHPSHMIAHELAAEEPYRTELGGYVRHWPVLRPEAYAQLLHDLGFARQHVRLQVYAHLLPSRDGVVEWVRGTLLTDYQQRMPPELFERYLADYRTRLAAALPDTTPFLYPFKRILIWAQKGKD
ncbi:MAG: methyltransferase domain-containing protein [Dehalococcoidia bacterium]|nr:methyltransferase domain-containing protein [Dehalococcoidia bacterium]